MPGDAAAIPSEAASARPVPVLPEARTVAHHRHPLQPHGDDDGAARGAHSGAAQDDERPRDQVGTMPDGSGGCILTRGGGEYRSGWRDAVTKSGVVIRLMLFCAIVTTYIIGIGVLYCFIV